MHCMHAQRYSSSELSVHACSHCLRKQSYALQVRQPNDNVGLFSACNLAHGALSVSVLGVPMHLSAAQCLSF